VNKEEITEGVKRKGSHGLILTPKLSKPARDKIAQQIAEFEAKGGKIEQIASVDEFTSTKKAAVVYSQN